MALKSNLSSKVPASERLKREFKLISSGYSLRPDAPGGKIVVYPWDSEVSEWLTSRSSEESPYGDFSVDIVKRLTRLPDKTLTRFVVSELLSVMLMARSIAHGGFITYRATCPHCKTKQKQSKIDPLQLGAIGAKDEDFVGYEDITLPETNDVVRLRPLLVSDLQHLSSVKLPPGFSKSGSQLAACIMSVNGTTADHPAELFEYYLALPPLDVETLQGANAKLNPAVDTNVPHRCDSEDCGKEFTHNIALTYDFFLPRLHG